MSAQAIDMEKLIARIQIPGQSEDRIEMATLISPTFAIAYRTPLLDDAIRTADALVLEFPGMDNVRLATTRIALFNDYIALFTLSSPVSDELFQWEFFSDGPIVGAEWNGMALVPFAPEFVRLQGNALRIQTQDGLTFTDLELTEGPTSPTLVAGAPVFMYGTFLGILISQQLSVSFFALSIPQSLRELALRDRNSWEHKADNQPPAESAEDNNEDETAQRSTSSKGPRLKGNAPPHKGLFTDDEFLEDDNNTEETAQEVSTDGIGTNYSIEGFYAQLDGQAQATVDMAHALGRGNKQSAVHMEHLVAALADYSGDVPARFIRSRSMPIGRLLSLLRTVQDSRLGPVSHMRQTEEMPPLPPSAHIQRAFREAWNSALKHGTRTITSWHLLAGVLSVEECSVTQMLVQHRITLDALLRYIENLEHPATPVIAGYRNDQAGGDDLLDIRKEAMALASVVTARDVRPPISIGLFGEWGSGKTFFMREMERCIETCLKESRVSNGQSPYCHNIAQIWFNSWHYIDTDLWASLTSEIFEGLAKAYAPIVQETHDQAIQRLIGDRRRATDILAEAEHRKELAEQELRDNKTQLTQLQSEMHLVEMKLEPVTLALEAARFAADQPEVQEKIEQAADALAYEGLKEKIEQNSAYLSELAQDATEVRLLWKSLGSNRNKLKLLLWLCLVVGISLAVIITVSLLESTTWEVIAGVIGTIIGVVTSFRKFITPAWNAARRALTFIKDAHAKQQESLAERKSRLKEQLSHKKEEIEGRIENVNKQITAAEQEVDKKKEELRKLHSARVLANFVGERDRSDDYRKHLGVITNARNDFERLSELMKKVREQKSDALIGDSDSNELPRFDRIILYIDDLDRCPEDRVVEVLQAVHLLLAFDPFVVVVGVDPRWLLRSLKQHSSAFDTKASGNDHDDRSHWQSTPMNYLEKIFQIPFTLRPMGATGFGKLMDTLVTPVASGSTITSSTPQQQNGSGGAQPATPAVTGDNGQNATGSTTNKNQAGPTPAITETQQPDGSQPDASGSTSGQTTTAITDGAASTITTPIPQHMAIEEWERDCMKLLHAFIPSPRAAKRFVNIYRLLRSSVEPHQREQFIGDHEQGGHRAALLLLAIQTGYPDEAIAILQKVMDANPGDRWWELVESFKPLCTDPGAEELENDPDSGRARKLSAERWRTMFARINTLQKLDPPYVDAEIECSDFIDWAPAVARYSFQSGRILSAQRNIKEQE